MLSRRKIFENKTSPFFSSEMFRAFDLFVRMDFKLKFHCRQQSLFEDLSSPTARMDEITAAYCSCRSKISMGLRAYF